MRPVHSADRWRPVCWQEATCPFCRRRACPFHWQAARPYCRVHYAHHYSYVPRKLPLHINTARATDIMAPGDRTGVTCIICSMYFFHYVPRPTCQGSATLYVPPLSYKREGTQRYNSGSQSHLDPTQVHNTHKPKCSDTQYNSQWSRILRSNGLNHSKSSCSPII
jgi:hypothetical protein